MSAIKHEIGNGDMVIMKTKAGRRLHGDVSVKFWGGGDDVVDVWLNRVIVRNVPVKKLKAVSSRPAWHEVEWSELK